MSKELKNKRKAEKKAAEKAAEKAEAWKSSSKTVLGRLTYRLKDLPDLQIIRVEFWSSKSLDENREVHTPDDYVRIYSRKHQEPAWKELLENAFLEYKDIAAINKKPVGRKHECHLIIPSHSIRNIRLGRYPLQTEYPGNDKLGLPGGRMECRVTGVSLLESNDDKDRKLYCKSLDLLIQSRHAIVDQSLGNLSMNRELFSKIPDSKAAPSESKTTSITPLIEGYTHKSSTDSQQMKERLYPLYIRSCLSIDAEEKLLHMVFDLTCALPTTYGNVYEILLDVFGDHMNEESIGRLQPIIRDLLVGLQVQRNYEHTKPKTTSESRNTWSEPFLIREIVFAKDVGEKIKDSDGKEIDVYGYFKKHYNQDRDIEHQYLPLIGDGRGSYFPMTKVKLPEKVQVFPKSADILSRPLRKKIHDLELLETDGQKNMKRMGETFWVLLIKQQQDVNIGKGIIQTAKGTVSTQQQPNAALKPIDRSGTKDELTQQTEPESEPNELLERTGKEENQWVSNDPWNLAL
ncbi:unnamed protein product [Alternaria alternata]